MILKITDALSPWVAKCCRSIADELCGCAGDLKRGGSGGARLMRWDEGCYSVVGGARELSWRRWMRVEMLWSKHGEGEATRWKAWDDVVAVVARQGEHRRRDGDWLKRKFVFVALRRRWGSEFAWRRKIYGERRCGGFGVWRRTEVVVWVSFV